MKKIIVAILVFISLVGLYFRFGQPEPLLPGLEPLPDATPTPTPFTRYTRPALPKKDSYTIFLVGDSMTEALGPHPFQLSRRLNDEYSEKSFIVDNYSMGSTNIFALPTLLITGKQMQNTKEPPVLDRPVDILVIESFGNNPLSDLPLEEGLQKQSEVLELTVLRLMREKPQTYIVFLATVAPSNRYAQGVLNLPPELRVNYANERRRYIENFIDFANKHEIPLVDVYHQTRLPTGDGDPRWLNPDDFIHPSQEGVELIQNKIADFLIEQSVIPR